MKFRDISALLTGTVTGSTVATVDAGQTSLESILASAAAAASVYLINALFRWISSKIPK